MKHSKRVTAVAASLIVATIAIAGLAESPTESQSTMGVVEIRTFKLKPGTRAEFHRVASEIAAPMQRRAGIDVVACGPSAHDEDSYYVIRAWTTLPERKRTEDAFYSSEEWKKGPEGEVMARILTYNTAVLHLDATTVEALRRLGCGRAASS